MTVSVVWSVVRGEARRIHAVEPAPNGMTLPLEILDWAGQHGLDPDDPDVYILVTLQEEVGEIPGEIACITGAVSPAEGELLRQALAAE